MAISTLKAHHRFRIFCGDEAFCDISSNDKFDLHQEQNLVDHTMRPYSLSQKAICFRTRDTPILKGSFRAWKCYYRPHFGLFLYPFSYHFNPLPWPDPGLHSIKFIRTFGDEFFHPAHNAAFQTNLNAMRVSGGLCENIFNDSFRQFPDLWSCFWTTFTCDPGLVSARFIMFICLPYFQWEKGTPFSLI